jgi:hypothetical protein
MFNQIKKIATAAAAFVTVSMAATAYAQDNTNYYVHTEENEYTVVDLGEFAANNTKKITVSLNSKIEADMARRTASLNDFPTNPVQVAEVNAVESKIDNMLTANYANLSEAVIAKVDANIPGEPPFATAGAAFAQAEEATITLANLQQ